MKFVDLSHPLASGMPVYPGDPEVSITPALSVATDGVAVSHLVLGSHSGTHIDAPSHSIEGGRTVDRIPLESLQGAARILHVDAAPRQRIAPSDVLEGIPNSLPRIVCVATGWDQHFGTPASTQHPFLSLELAQLLWQRGARILGTDALSPDATAGADTLPVHEWWLGRDGVIAENLTGLTALPEAIEVSLLPLRILGADGSPIRAIARIPESPYDRPN